MCPVKKILLITLGSLSLALGFVGVFVPVLPTTPLVLLAAFLYSRSSERLDAWIKTTAVYRSYVEPFKANGGISKKKKVRILVMSYVVMAISAVLVQKWFVWLILAAVAIFLWILMFVKIPTISEETELEYGVMKDLAPQSPERAE